MEVLVLASGSSGNAVAVSSGGTTLLVDCGISTLQLRRRLEAFGRAVDGLAAVLVTHEHSDHCRGLEVLTRRHAVPVWATAGTWRGLPRCTRGGELASGREQRFGSLRVVPVATSHDAAEPVALVLDDGQRRIAVCTDTGHVTELLAQRLGGCHCLLLETNHDADMLRHGPYPWHLKQRIASRHGHLGNHQSEETVERLAHEALCAVVGLHLSEENNLPELAAASLRRTAPEACAVAVVPRHRMLRLDLGAVAPVLEESPAPPARGAVSWPGASLPFG